MRPDPTTFLPDGVRERLGSMSFDIPIGDTVEWTWGTGSAKVTDRFTSRVTRKIDETDVTRNASEDEPAYMIEQHDDGRVLKATSELFPAE